MSFAEIVGQEDAKSLLKNAVNTGKHSHAYIFSGEKGSGKMMLAEAFAAMLQCENPSADDACGECHCCKQSLSHNNPDIIYVSREEGKSNISVDVIREKIVNDVDIKPYSNKFKIYIVEEAERMNPQAQNAILKTIEEPPEYAIIILLTANHNAFLQTILSRCVLIQTKTVDTASIRNILQTKYETVDYQAEMVANFAQGNVGKAIALATDVSFSEVKDKVVSICKRAGRMDEQQIADEVKDIKAANESDKKAEDTDAEKFQGFVEQMLDLITLWYRDVLLYKATLNDNLLLFKEDAFDIHEQAQHCSYSGLNHIINEIAETRARLNANVNFELTIMLLIQALKENSK
ncbi:ATP-binding protein [Pseudobutyrivibrio xylanivorans]|uniref:DNA polymerase III subunit delta' n=1 Tax=Pseudobutyrivibrio xylanivorans TaxID=185007 RepID=A0A5P6VTF3_PSEXY|nr:DNA polymerase III subunit delta' C-terminal domain-containing protein [Pseudobutyrivibrio xylanivorans]QFJ54161.1 DNA polymerase III subunit delta [Pseudobutyrivibrio xylanivorans]